MKIIGTLISYFIVFSAIGGILVLVSLQSIMAPGPLPMQKTVIIDKGASVNNIADTLLKEGVIGSPLVFKIASRVISDPTKLKAGEYSFPANIPLTAVIGKLQIGDTVKHQITIPEGLTSYEVVELLKANEDLGGDIATVPAEGSLLPETYSFELGDSRQAKLDQMASNMNNRLEELWEKRQQDLPFKTKEEALTLASIVEKETGIPSERARIAGVFVNRLKAGIPLQTDPTVIYAMHQGKPDNKGLGPIGRRLLKKDLEIDSPYNTYKNIGLPPGPIANPGRDAIEATLQPEQNDYLFFVADGTGGHLFAKTLDEHNTNVENWRKARKDKEDAAKKQKETPVNGPLFE